MTNTTETLEMAQTPAERKAAERKRQRQAGRVAVTVWIDPADRKKVTKYIDRLNERVRIKPEPAKKLMGFYTITNKVNGRVYYGQAKDIKARWVGHKALLRAGKHHTHALQSDWKIYQESDFEFAIVKLVEIQQIAVNMERDHIESNKATCYNTPRHTKETWRAKFPVGFGKGRPDLPRRIKPSQLECAAT